MIDYADALKLAPSMVAELRSRLIPEKGEKAERVAASTTPSAPLSLSAMADADALYALLYRHAENVADLLNSTPPKVPILSGWEPIGLPSGITPEKAYDHARKLARYLEHQTHLVPIAWQMKIRREVQKVMGRLVEKYPTHEPPELLNARCRGCDKLALYRHAPKHFKGDERFKCHSCGLHHSSAEVRQQQEMREKEIN